MCSASQVRTAVCNATVDTTCSDTCAAGSYADKATQQCVLCVDGSKWDNDQNAATPCVACQVCSAEQVQTAACTTTTETGCSVSQPSTLSPSS